MSRSVECLALIWARFFVLLTKPVLSPLPGGLFRSFFFGIEKMIVDRFVDFVFKNKSMFQEKNESEKTEMTIFFRSVLGQTRARLFFFRPNSSNTCKTIGPSRKKTFSSRKVFIFHLKITSIDSPDDNLSIGVFFSKIEDHLRFFFLIVCLLALGRLA